MLLSLDCIAKITQLIFGRYILIVLGSLNPNDNGNAKQKVLLAEQWLCTYVIILGTFLCRPLQNNMVIKFCVVWTT